MPKIPPGYPWHSLAGCAQGLHAVGHCANDAARQERGVRVVAFDVGVVGVVGLLLQPLLSEVCISANDDIGSRGTKGSVSREQSDMAGDVRGVVREDLAEADWAPLTKVRRRSRLFPRFRVIRRLRFARWEAFTSAVNRLLYVMRDEVFQRPEPLQRV